MDDAITAGRSREQHAARSNAMALLDLFDGPGTAVVGCTRDGSIGYWSAGAAQLFGKDAAEVVGRGLRDVVDSALLPAVGRQQQVCINGRALQVEARAVPLSQHGFPYPLLVVFRGAAAPGGTHGLSGRTRVLDQLQDALARHLRQDSYGALLVLDIDSFASLRSELGAAGSEAVLEMVATRLRAQLREGDLAERLDGDQFAVVCSALSHDAGEAARDAGRLARDMLDSLATPLAPGGRNVQANVGVTVFGARGASPESLLRDALFSLRAAKITGPDAVHVFNERMRQLHNRQVALRADLRQALARRALQVYYQVQVNLDGVANGVEALARWYHPEQGWVPPDLFIPVAEASGLIGDLGQWVLEQACEDLVRWRHGAAGRLSVSVNVSPLQLRQPDFAEAVLRTVRAYGVEPGRLKLEVTETALIDEMDAAVDKLAALRSAGIRVSLDDFGKGYSALAYLKRLPLDQVKIDQAFVRDIVGSPVDQEIAAAIISLAHGLHLDAIAEGIETREQYMALRDLGCRSFQGYLFGKPQPARELEAALCRQAG